MEREITHRCGHTRRHHVGGYFVADQDREALRLARKRCPDCLRLAERRAGAATAAAPALPALIGSPRQVAWAERIRDRQLAALGRLGPGPAPGLDPAPGPAPGLNPAIVAAVAMVADARWWIDRRTADPRSISPPPDGA